MADQRRPAPPPDLNLDDKARRRGRMGLAIPWEAMPWWAIIVLIVGVLVGFSVFSNHYYRDALGFIFDLPWHKSTLRRVTAADIGEGGIWSYTLSPLREGRYTLYAEYFDSDGDFLGRDTVYKVQVGAETVAAVMAPLPAPVEDGFVLLDTTTPTLGGVVLPGTREVRVFDDFRDQPGRVAQRIWSANGVVLTIKVTLISFAAAVVIGLIFGIMRVASGSPDLRANAQRRLLIGLLVAAVLLLLRPEWRAPRSAALVLVMVEAVMFLLPAMPYTISTLYVEIVRGVPMLVIILYMGFAATPAVRDATGGRVDMRGLPAAVIGLAFGYGAYLAEVFRAGIQSVSHGQIEAARSLGMNYYQTMRFVILPQAIRVILPPLGNDFIAMLKDSSLISVIALPEVLQQGRLWISRNFRAFEGYNSVMMVYLVMTLLLSLLVRSIEQRAKLPGKT